MTKNLRSNSTHTGVQIPVRRLDFEFDARAVPTEWYAEDLYLTHVFQALSIAFPEGEKFFVEAVRHYRDQITDPALKAAVAGFAGQEAMHGRGHRAFNEIIDRDGSELGARLEREVIALLDIGRKLPPKVQLAITCALEHYTAILGEQLLATNAHQDAIHASVRPLWLWHALEESEHKAVAYDVYQAVHGTYAMRTATMLVTSLIFFAAMGVFYVRLLARDGRLLEPRAWIRTVLFLWAKPGLFRKLVPGFLQYFRPGFHPNDHDSTADLERMQARLFGHDGLLADGKLHVTLGASAAA
jgi:uncharacterized protein